MNTWWHYVCVLICSNLVCVTREGFWQGLLIRSIWENPKFHIKNHTRTQGMNTLIKKSNLGLIHSVQVLRSAIYFLKMGEIQHNWYQNNILIGGWPNGEKWDKPGMSIALVSIANANIAKDYPSRNVSWTFFVHLTCVFFFKKISHIRMTWKSIAAITTLPHVSQLISLPKPKTNNKKQKNIESARNGKQSTNIHSPI